MVNDGLLIILVEDPNSGLRVTSTVSAIVIVRRVLDNDGTLHVWVDGRVFAPVGSDNLCRSGDELGKFVCQPPYLLLV